MGSPHKLLVMFKNDDELDGARNMFRMLHAVKADGTQINVKIKLDCDEHNQVCQTFNCTIQSSKTSCGTCKLLGGGSKINPARSDMPTCETFQLTDSMKEGSHTSTELQGCKEETSEVSMGERLPKRKRTNIYSSLSLAAIEATARARAEAYALLPSSPQLASRNQKKSQVKDKKNARPPTPPVDDSANDMNEFIGQDGNLFYCFVCRGVGEVVCCDGCPHVYHPSCIPHGPSKISLENDDDPWYCHECLTTGKLMKNLKDTNLKKRKHVKQRCSVCGCMESKAHPCIPCSSRNCDNFIHPICPQPGNCDHIDHLSRRTRCSTCKSNGNYFNQVFSPRDGRGRGLCFTEPKILRRMSSSEERKKRSTKVTEDRTTYSMYELNKAYSSGFQAPYIESDDDEDGIKSISFIEKPVSSIPGFFFFLLHNRSAIEKSISRKNPSFRKLTKIDMNEKVAEAGACLWIDLSQSERNKWIEVSMKDFELRVVNWKQQEVIQSMIESIDENDNDTQGGGHFSKSGSHSLSESSQSIAELGTHQLCENRMKNHVLHELLHDMRHHPLPMFGIAKCASERTESADATVKLAVQQFEIQGPIASSLGDNCMGCTRGWNHFCSVLKRPLPSCKHRARLQPPVSSLTVIRVGAGLRVDLPCRFDQPQQQTDETAVGFDYSEICPNYQPRVDFHLSSPSSRLDDIAQFTERLMKLKQLQANSPSDESLEKSGRKPLVCQTQFCDVNGSVESNTTTSRNFRKSQIVAQIAKKHNHKADISVRPSCAMLGQNKKIRSSKCRNINRDGMVRVGFNFTKESWAPNAILPPNPKALPKLWRDNLQAQNCSEKECFKPTSLRSVEGAPRNCCKCSLQKGTSMTANSCTACARRCTGGHVDAIRPRSRSLSAGKGEVLSDRNALALKHKYDADDLSRRCLAIACSGVLAGLVRRDPLGLFAEPVPADVLDYHNEIADPIDCSLLRQRILNSHYTSLGSFISDARRLCINACVFNAADSLYAKTAKNMYDSIEVMHSRAKKWMTILKNAHASSFITNEDKKRKSNVDAFKDVKLAWPEAVEILEVDGEWLKKLAASSFTRTIENEVAYYGSLALKRAAAAAKASLTSVTDESRAIQPVMKRSHGEDELLRKQVDAAAAVYIGPITLSGEPDLVELQLLRLLKRIQKHCIEKLTTPDSSCARCDGLNVKDACNVEIFMRSNFKKSIESTRPRIAVSRMTCVNSRAFDFRSSEERYRVANENMVSVRGSRIHGWGLFVDRPFQSGEIIAEYIGEYISNNVADLREKRYRKQRIQDYQFRIDRSLVIDATMCGGHARYINHSCDPNCTAKIVNGRSPNEHLKRVLIVCQRDVRASEELTYDYNFPFETNLDLRIPCNCRSKQCRGFLNWDSPETRNSRPVKSINSGQTKKDDSRCISCRS